MPAMTVVEICEYDTTWPQQFLDIERRLRAALGEGATRIDHIGSTSVPRLAAKDVIDVQISVTDEPGMEAEGAKLEADGWIRGAGIRGDHLFPAADQPLRMGKIFFSEPSGHRRTNVHIRVQGWPNQRYALLFRDYLRAHPEMAEAYARLKRHLAGLLPDDSGRYADVKDPACDLIYLAAEQWAAAGGWAEPR